MSKKVIPEALMKILQTHTVPGQYLPLFQQESVREVQVVKSKEKKKKKNAQSLNHLIPKIQLSLMQMREDKALKKLFKGIKFTKIEADTKLLTIYYQLSKSAQYVDHGSARSLLIYSNQIQSTQSSQDNPTRDLESLLYKYLCREVQVKTFSSKLELKRDFVAEVLLKVEKEMKKL